MFISLFVLFFMNIGCNLGKFGKSAVFCSLETVTFFSIYDSPGLTSTYISLYAVQFHILTSPSEDSKVRSFLQEALNSPTPALTSTPLGASSVSVLVGDSSLLEEDRLL